jgi:hypothetical protein
MQSTPKILEVLIMYKKFFILIFAAALLLGLIKTVMDM